jgi:hypothetical protein
MPGIPGSDEMEYAQPMHAYPHAKGVSTGSLAPSQLAQQHAPSLVNRTPYREAGKPADQEPYARRMANDEARQVYARPSSQGARDSHATPAQPPPTKPPTQGFCCVVKKLQQWHIYKLFKIESWATHATSAQEKRPAMRAVISKTENRGPYRYVCERAQSACVLAPCAFAREAAVASARACLLCGTAAPSGDHSTAAFGLAQNVLHCPQHPTTGALVTGVNNGYTRNSEVAPTLTRTLQQVFHGVPHPHTQRLFGQGREQAILGLQGA